MNEWRHVSHIWGVSPSQGYIPMYGQEAWTVNADIFRPCGSFAMNFGTSINSTQKQYFLSKNFVTLSSKSPEL